MPTDCLFCRIVAGEVPSTTVRDDELVLAIRDVAPQAPTHVLLLPKEHIPSVAALTDAHAGLLGRMFALSAEIARDEGIEADGYRVVSNVGAFGGQSVEHLHVHLLGGRRFSWPPG